MLIYAYRIRSFSLPRILGTERLRIWVSVLLYLFIVPFIERQTFFEKTYCHRVKMLNLMLAIKSCLFTSSLAEITIKISKALGPAAFWVIFHQSRGKLAGKSSILHNLPWDCCLISEIVSLFLLKMLDDNCWNFESFEMFSLMLWILRLKFNGSSFFWASFSVAV